MSVRSLVSVDDHLVLRVTLAILASLVAPLAAAQSAPSTSSGQSYPSKTIRIIASQAPGGGIDTVCRIVAPKLSDAFGQNVIVDNRPGANGSLAAEVTAKSPSDGHTLMLGAVGNLSTNVLFYKKLGYDPQRDLAPVTSAVLSVNVLVVHPSVPAHTVKELIALARRRPNELAAVPAPASPDPCRPDRTKRRAREARTSASPATPRQCRRLHPLSHHWGCAP